jgi:2-hydroxy-3-keto-5-methylthiopentenyl-1-phosphate phosphatase
MDKPYFVVIDFDGTVTDVDLIDAVLQDFARPEWLEVEKCWEQGSIGSRQCLETQMSMVDRSLDELLDYIDTFAIDETFRDFIAFLDEHSIPYAIMSDGFQVFIERLLDNAGLKHVPVYANLLTEERGKLRTHFPYSRSDCDSANCKCAAVEDLSKGRPLVVIGDGRSDFCVAHKAFHAFTKNKLTDHCHRNDISHTPFCGFGEITEFLRTMSVPEVNVHTIREERA